MVSIYFFWFYLFIPIILILITFHLICSFSKSEKLLSFINKYSFILVLFLIFLIIGKIFFFPYVYIVNNNNTFEKNILLFPTKNMSYSFGTYIINNSEKNLIFEPNFYGLGHHRHTVCEKKQYIRPKEKKEVAISDIDFFLEGVPLQITVGNYDSCIRYSVSFERTENYNNKDIESGDSEPSEYSKMLRWWSENIGMIFWSAILGFVGVIVLLLILSFVIGEIGVSFNYYKEVKDKYKLRKEIEKYNKRRS